MSDIENITILKVVNSGGGSEIEPKRSGKSPKSPEIPGWVQYTYPVEKNKCARVPPPDRARSDGDLPGRRTRT